MFTLASERLDDFLGFCAQPADRARWVTGHDFFRSQRGDPAAGRTGGLMKTLTVLCNVVLLGFTVLVLATEGPSREVPYIVFTLLLLLIPIFTVLVIVRSETGKRTAIGRVAATCNLILLGLICWAIADQYPHPEEPGVVEYAALTVLTPILSAVVLFRGDRGHGRRTLQTKSATQQP